ncbi:MAG: hypothetical protein ACW967_07785 [Candidatus Hodarchaeales archaeon]|jgi:hypothetical protein
MPLDLSKLKDLIEELEEKEKTSQVDLKLKKLFGTNSSINSEITKKKKLLPTEKKAYFDITNHFQLVTSSIDDPSIAYEIWIKGILPLILPIHGIEFEEWDRICNIGDSDANLEIDLKKNWKAFLQNKVQKGLINEEIWELILEGKKRLEALIEE